MRKFGYIAAGLLALAGCEEVAMQAGMGAPDAPVDMTRSAQMIMGELPVTVSYKLGTTSTAAVTPTDGVTMERPSVPFARTS